jgi:hypothetical protein
MPVFSRIAAFKQDYPMRAYLHECDGAFGEVCRTHLEFQFIKDRYSFNIECFILFNSPTGLAPKFYPVLSSL